MAEAKGFQELVRSGITLAVGQTLRVDLQLPVGLLTQKVTVSGNIAKVETENATVSDVVTSRQIGFGTGIGTGVRCNTVGALKIQKGTVNDPQFGPVPTWFNPTVITQPLASQLEANGQPGMFGDMGRNALTGPGRNNWDLALHKDFKLPWFGKEKSTLQARLDTFNTFNHPQWKYINAGCAGTIPFGQPCTQVGNAEVTGAWRPRNVELGMKDTF
jgi:hypothetical protein